MSDINYSIDFLEHDESFRSHITRTLKVVKNSLNISGATVVEVGCGLGSNLKLFAQDNCVIGIEGLPQAVEQACKSGLDVRQANLENATLPLPDNISALTLCIDVLEHIVNAENLLNELVRITRPDGFIVINVPNHFTLKGRLKILFGSGMDVHNYFPECDDWNNPHVRFFTASGFERLLTKVGIKVVNDFSYMGTVEFLSPDSEARWRKKLKRSIYDHAPSLILGGYFIVGQWTACPNNEDRHMAM